MARGNCTFKRDVTAAVKAVMTAVVVVARIEIDRDSKNAIRKFKNSRVGSKCNDG